ncbi:MAG: SPFH domain-containing protein [Blastocatellia bacterium]
MDLVLMLKSDLGNTSPFLMLLQLDLFFIFGAGVAVVLFFTVVSLLQSVIRVCPPNQVLVVTGAKTLINGKEYGFRIQKGGWTYVVPYLQSAQTLDLSILPINVKIEGVNSANGITVGADATACVCVDDKDEVLLYSAVERLMGKSRREIQEQIQQTMVGNFRGALNKTTPLQAIGMEEDRTDESSSSSMLVRSSPGALVVQDGERAHFRHELLKDSSQDLSTFGMRVVSVSLQKIWDTSNYIANLASKTLSQKRQEVEIQEARLHARAEQAESDSSRRQMIAISQANEKILATQQQLEVFRRECDASIERTRLEADSAIALAMSEGERKVQEAMIELQQLKNISQVTLEAEARKRVAEIRAEGESEAIRIFQGLQNDLLKQKVNLIAQNGDSAKTAIFVQQHLAQLFEAYQEHVQGMGVDNLVMMDPEKGFNGVVNRGPEALVDFLKHFEAGFGISVRDLLALTNKTTTDSK